MKWRKRAFLYDASMGLKVPRSTVLRAEEEALTVAFRKHALLPLDDCLYASLSPNQVPPTFVRKSFKCLNALRSR
jgi:hypothetical protein